MNNFPKTGRGDADFDNHLNVHSWDEEKGYDDLEAIQLLADLQEIQGLKESASAGHENDVPNEIYQQANAFRSYLQEVVDGDSHLSPDDIRKKKADARAFIKSAENDIPNFQSIL